MRPFHQRERRSTKWPGKQAVWINQLIPASKNGDAGMSILAAPAGLSRKTSGEQSSGCETQFFESFPYTRKRVRLMYRLPQHGGDQWESGAGAPAHQNLAAPRTRRVNAKRPGVRNASSALADKLALSTNSSPEESRFRQKISIKGRDVPRNDRGNRWFGQINSYPHRRTAMRV